jgi:hypothetical protein
VHITARVGFHPIAMERLKSQSPLSATGKIYPSVVITVDPKLIMKESPSDIPTPDYLAALRFHVETDSPAILQAAQILGGTAMKHGSETLMMAKMHAQALAVLLSTESSLVEQKELTRKASAFFAEAIMPIEETHQAAPDDSADFEQLNTSLRQRTEDLAETNRKLRIRIDERESLETPMKVSESSTHRLLKDSQRLEQNLKEMTRKIFSATENKREPMGPCLNNEIAQALSGINIRMVALQIEIDADLLSHNHEFEMIQQLIEDSAEMIERSAYEFSDKHT